MSGRVEACAALLLLTSCGAGASPSAQSAPAEETAPMTHVEEPPTRPPTSRGPSLELARAYRQVGRPDTAIAIFEGCVREEIEPVQARVEILEIVVEFLPLWQQNATTDAQRAQLLDFDSQRFLGHYVELIDADLPSELERRRDSAQQIFAVQYEQHYRYDSEAELNPSLIDFLRGVRRVDAATVVFEALRAQGTRVSPIVTLRLLEDWIALHEAIGGDRRQQILASGATEAQLELALTHDRARLRDQLSRDLEAEPDDPGGPPDAEQQRYLDRRLGELRARFDRAPSAPGGSR